MVTNRAAPGGHEARTGRRLWLIRHGETVGESSVRYFGATDVALSDVGRDQVRTLAPLLADCRFEAVVHSPLSRAVDSAAIVVGLAAEVVREPVPIEALREIDFGTFEGWTAGEIRDRHPSWFDDWRAGRIDGFPDGETLAGFHARVADGVADALESVAGDLAIVAHRGVVKATVCELLGLDRAVVRPWSLDLASATVLVEDDSAGGWILDRYNLIGIPATTGA